MKNIEDLQLQQAVFDCFKRNPISFNGKNFCIEVNAMLGKELEYDTIKRELRRLRQKDSISYRVKKNGKRDFIYIKG